ncbi:MAG: alpha/beta fold hydrolase [Bacteroidota bacterium]
MLLACQSEIDQQPLDFAGRWYAKAEKDSLTQHYLFDVRFQDSQYVAFLDLPGEGLFRLPLDSVSSTRGNDHQKVYFSQAGLELEFKGLLLGNPERLEGEIQRGGLQLPLNCFRTPQVPRSQLLDDELPYLEEEVVFYNQDQTALVGTLTIPSLGSASKAVVLVSGSGPQNRDEEILGHRPFAVLADHLTRQGVAVLRYDDRGYGRSGGVFRPATTMDYAEDALAAVHYLRDLSDLNVEQIGVVGHSEGGNIAPVVASWEESVDFVILLAGPGVSNYEGYLVSLDTILRAYPETYDRDFPFFSKVYATMAQLSDRGLLRDSLEQLFQGLSAEMSEEELSIYGGAKAYVASEVAAHSTEWYHHFLQFDVTPYLKKIEVPILALNGDKDDSVIAWINLEGLEQTLSTAGHTAFKTVELPGVNHFFQESDDSSIDKVYFNEVTFSTEALRVISDWIEEL